MKKELLIFGCGGHAKVITDAVERCGNLTIRGFVDSIEAPGGQNGNYPILGNEEVCRRSLQGDALLVVAVGENWKRLTIVERILALPDPMDFATIVHPSAQVAKGVLLGPGTVVLAQAVVNPGSVLGNHALVNSGAIIEHDCKIADFVNINPGVVLGGSVSVGKCSTVGLGAGVIHGIRIGEHSVVGAGSCVLHNIADGVVAFGSPARVIRPRAANEPVL